MIGQLRSSILHLYPHVSGVRHNIDRRIIAEYFSAKLLIVLCRLYTVLIWRDVTCAQTSVSLRNAIKGPV